jgi:3',5'-cyclic AMP phosphodiesterase CpdA
VETQLPAFADKEIRVLCMHHSPTYVGTARSLRSLEVDNTSRQRLARFIIDNRISVVLCGHLHSPPFVQQELAKTSTKQRLFLEARCGSTSQAKPSDLLPSIKSKLRSLGILPSERTNSLLIHRVIERNGRVEWETEINLLYPGKFAKPPSAKIQNNQQVTVPFKVWP